MSGLVPILLFVETLFEHLAQLVLQSVDHSAVVVEEDPIVVWEVLVLDFVKDHLFNSLDLFALQFLYHSSLL